MTLPRFVRCAWAGGVPAILTGGRSIPEGEVLPVLRAYWRNGEGWYRLRDAYGRAVDAPDVFFVDCAPTEEAR